MGDVFASSSLGDPFSIRWKSLWKAKIPRKFESVGNVLCGCPTAQEILTAPPFSIQNRNDKLWSDNAKNASTIVACTMAWRTKARVHWSPPMSGLLCMNVDGAYVSSLQHGGIGGVLRNEKGEFIAGFAYRVTNVSSAYHAELLAIKSGLELIQVLGVSNVAIKSDCLEAVKAVTAEDHDFSTLRIIVEEFKNC
ncbi:uncharacterized protein LOC133729456 [Rosa rugosa]|uniref:uncharacterized protein LOC133729456 n=1 Tax=Rosa rugosa TaxID=74645 RepID=UPI002B414C00|nr:uncharacterized protein LOC133729456 [Rosa rugosa]